MAEAPSALIYGSDNFVAKKLGELLANRGISVFWDDDEIDRPLYFFDFGGGEKRSKEINEKKVKMCKVIRNEELGIRNNNVENNYDSRTVVLYDVYGVGMNRDWWFGEAVEQAARNKNLVLPAYGEKFRLLAVEDAVEAIMRAVIMSGTTGKVFEIGGVEIESKIVASALIDLAKMTKTEIGENVQLPIANFQLEKEFDASARALRWKPMMEFRQGIKEVVAEAVARVDEEGRKKKFGIRNEEFGIKKEKEKSNQYVVEVEKDEPEKVIIEPEVKVKEQEVEIEEDEIEEEDRVIGKKIAWNTTEPNLFEEKEIVKEIVEVPISKPTISKQVPNDKFQITNKKEIVFPWKKVGMAVGVVFLITGLVYGWFLWGMVSVAMNLQKPIKLLEEKKIVEAKKLVEKYRAKNNMVAGFWSNTKLGEIVKISSEALDIETKLCVLADSMDKINGAVFEEKVIDFKAELTTISKNLLEIETEVGVISARLDSVRKWVPGRWRPQVDEVMNLITKNVDLVSKTRQMVGVMPEILGLDGKRREYLVLLQNEMELRATGGFIGSYGILSFQDGRLISFDIKDVYEADGQLQGHVEPPEEIKKYLGEAGWFMRDANWKASFPESSRDIQWFFEKEVGRKVDGVIGVNLAVVKAMLNATGPIFVPDFKEKVDKDNLYEQAEFYSESKFFPGSVQKASFLSGVGKQLFEEISNLKSVARWKLMMGMVESLERNDMQIALNNTVAGQVIGDLGWNGEMFDGSCGIKDCYTDYLYIVESNFGVNKANYFLYRNLEQKVDIKELSVDRILRINYENMAKSNNWPGGDYKNYLRIYLPKDVQVSEVTVMTGGQVQNVPLDQVKMTNVNDKREIGFLVTVPITKKVVVEVKYSSKIAQMMDKFSYLLYIQRQPGFGDTGMINLVSMPSGYQPMQVQPEASVVSGKLLFNQKLDKDIKMGVEIAK